MSAINNRYDFVILYDVENGNPNGDPDAGNCPRIDPETNLGLVTDVCIKRKIRNYVELAKEGVAGYNILVKPDASLNAKFTNAYEECGIPTGKNKKTEDEVRTTRDFMCKNYFDVRAFGSVMSTGDNPCGIVRGPVQITFSKSISPIHVQDVTITRQARTTEDRKETGTTEIGRKSIVPYALYRAEGYISASQAQKVTGFNDEDLQLLWDAIINMFENDRSAARGKMSIRKLYVFKHDNVLGNCPSNILFDKITVTQNDPSTPPRQFVDYSINIDETMPSGVEFQSKL